MSESEYVGAAPPAPEHRESPLKSAVREARIEAADRSAVVVDLHDAELARLEILNEALNSVFKDLPAGIEMFDRGITPGEPPRLWIDMVAHVAMGRDKRLYRFMQDTRYGRRVLAESPAAEEIARAVTQYVARRLIERERALAGDTTPLTQEGRRFAKQRRRRRWRGFVLFLLGVLFGAVGAIGALIAAVLLFYSAG
jgi:hypothetical protein